MDLIKKSKIFLAGQKDQKCRFYDFKKTENQSDIKE